jgi:hypothetical protein
MNPFLTGEARRSMAEHERAREDVHPLDWQDDLGPLSLAQFVEVVAHEQAIEAAGGDPAQEHELCTRLGYRDVFHFRRVRTTFLKYCGKSTGGDTLRGFVWDSARLAAANSTLELAEGARRARAAVAANPAMIAPEAGVPIEACGWVYGWAEGGRPFEQALAATGLDAGTWERAYHGWAQRIGRDGTGTLKALFSEAYHAGSAGTPYKTIR